MELSEANIKKHISDGRIMAITLDTCIFEGNGNRFERGLLAKLSQFNNTDVRFVLSDVVVGEVMSHVTKDAQDSMLAVVKALKEVGKCWQATDEQRNNALAALFKAESPNALTQRRFNDFVEATQLEVITSEGLVDLNKLLQDYFSVTPPFGVAATKKNEFPDAIALHALDSWAHRERLLLLAVSKDSDWKKYCKNSRNLVVVDDLAQALSYFHQNAEVACARLVQRLNDGKLILSPDLESAVQYAVERIDFIPEISSGYYFDAELGEVEVKSIKLQHETYHGMAFRVVDKPDENMLVVEAEVDVIIDVSADFSFSIYDSIDKDEVPIGSASSTTEKILTLKVLLTFEGDLAAEDEDFDIDIDFEVETPDRSVYVDFGGLGPDWERED